MSLTIGSLFSGIGGLELGLEMAGLGPVLWQVESDVYARSVLARHWPTVTRYDDVRTVGAGLEPVDLICGGFPCQDISLAGKGAGLDGSRSGLWFEYLRIVRELRPRYVLVENVAALLARGIGAVLGGLAESGYDAEWDCVPAVAAGAPHRRDRLFIVGTLRGTPDSDKSGRRAGLGHLLPWQPNPAWSGWGEAPPAICGVDDGIPRRVERLRCLGNAVVPQVAEWIGRRIVEADRARGGR